MNKLCLPVDKLYIIRSTMTHLDGSVQTMYYETPVIWSRTPANATVFQDYEVATAHLVMYHERDRAKYGWGDDRTEVMDVVPLHGELMRFNAKMKTK